MTLGTSAALILVRHAPAVTGGGLAGRRDVPADVTDDGALSRMRDWLGVPARLVTSPALRCQQTAAALFPEYEPHEDARLWEQDFGDHEGLKPTDLPDLGPLSRPELAAVAPPSGESFNDMVERVSPALDEIAHENDLGGPTIVVAHAGTVRAALAVALEEVPSALAFEVAPLSATCVRFFTGGASIAYVNVTP